MPETIHLTVQEQNNSVNMSVDPAIIIPAISPTATVERVDGGAVVTVTDKNGTTQAEIHDGQQGPTGPTGPQGTQGDPGTVPIDDSAGIGDTTKVWSADKSATEANQLLSAINALEGMVADAESSTTAASAHAINTVFIMSGKLYMATAAIAVGDTIVTSGTGRNAIEVTLAEAFPHDVQINGSSILSNGVANVQKATNANNSWGVVKIGAGLYGDDSGIMVNKALSTDIKLGSGFYKPIVPTTQHEAVFYGLAKAAGSDEKNSSLAIGNYTESAKSAISTMLNGAVSVSGSTPSITALPGVRYVCGECSTLDITVPASGDVEVIFESGSTATVLTVTPPSGVTAVQWANGFDPSSLDVNTRYDLIITDGEWGIAASWA